VAIFRELGDRWSVAASLHNLGAVTWKLGDLGRAREYLAEALLALRDLGDRGGVAENLAAFGALAISYGLHDRAARLFGVVATIEKEFVSIDLDSDITSEMSKTREELGDDEFELEWARGRGMSIEQAIELALEQVVEQGEDRS
jgi:hypothetical protein